MHKFKAMCDLAMSMENGCHSCNNRFTGGSNSEILKMDMDFKHNLTKLTICHCNTLSHP